MTFRHVSRVRVGLCRAPSRRISLRSLRCYSTPELAGQLLPRIDHVVCLGFHQPGMALGGAGKADAPNPRAVGGSDIAGLVANHDGLAGFEAELVQRGYEQVGMGFHQVRIVGVAPLHVGNEIGQMVVLQVSGDAL